MSHSPRQTRSISAAASRTHNSANHSSAAPAAEAEAEDDEVLCLESSDEDEMSELYPVTRARSSHVPRHQRRKLLRKRAASQLQAGVGAGAGFLSSSLDALYRRTKAPSHTKAKATVAAKEGGGCCHMSTLSFYLIYLSI